MVDFADVLKGRSAAYLTLGCKLNFAETSAVGRALERAGVRTAGVGECADICVVNTCSVTEVADHKCRQAIRRMVKRHCGALVVVTGCYAQLRPLDIAAIEGVDIVLGTEQKGDVVRYVASALAARTGGGGCIVEGGEIKSFVPSCARGDRTRYFLKVQDGCNYRCTYCTIPMARGLSRNGSIDSVVSQAREVAREGGREIVLTGVNVGDFGRSTGERFVDLLRALDGVEGISRFRISSIEPDLLTDEVLEFCASSRAFVPHFHLPLQSGCDRVLRLMGRRYSAEMFGCRVAKVKELMPDAFIGVDVIVGMRGESEDFFRESYDFIESLDVSQLHVFSYSERPGTVALRIPHIVSPEEKHHRSALLLSLSEVKRVAFYERFCGCEACVLVETVDGDGVAHGFTANYIRTDVVGCGGVVSNSLLDVRLGGLNVDGSALSACVVC